MRRMALFTSVQGVKDIFLLLLLIAFFSMLLTYHIGLYLPHPPVGHREPQENHVFKFHEKRIIRKTDTGKEVFLQKKQSIQKVPAASVPEKLNILDKIFKVNLFLFEISYTWRNKFQRIKVELLK